MGLFLYILLVFTDINECDQGEAGCDASYATCTNTDGGFTCDCNVGYSGDGASCTGNIMQGKIDL